MLISAVEGTDLFVAGPRQIVRVGLTAEPTDPRAAVWLVRVEGPTVTTPQPVLCAGPGGTAVVDVPVLFAAPAAEGSRHRVTAIVELERAANASAGERRTADGFVEAAATGWTMWMVSHFHYDPVWWNTQGAFTQNWYDVPAAEAKRPAFVRTAFDLVRAHMDAARHDPDYRFVLAELDYLKPYWDTRPQDRAELRELLAGGRLELVGGSYNEPNTNLTHPESTIRNFVYGMAYQREVLGGNPRTAWQLDVFGHDPSYPGIVAQTGLDSAVWARGPFHHVGPKRHTGDITLMQFASEFEWIGPSGHGVLTHYLSDHYVAGWQFEVQSTLEDAMADAYREFRELKQVAATHNVLLPVGHDHNVPSRWCTEIHREWRRRYLWPRFRVGLPHEFFAAVRSELAQRETGSRPALRPVRPQTRDMNPVYTGKDVSYIDTKQAQRAAEVAVLDAERLATLAWLQGDAFPGQELDKAWRQLIFGAHHDAITGTESDQVYIDLIGGWREAYDLGQAVRNRAAHQLAARVDTTGDGHALMVTNTLSWPRDGVIEAQLEFPQPGVWGVELRDDHGDPVPTVTEAVGNYSDGSLAHLTITALVRDVPALGYRIYRAHHTAIPPETWTSIPTGGVPTIENDAFLVEADPARGGVLTRILDRRHDRELIRRGGVAAEPYVQAEYPTHPVWEEGPWHLLPKGAGRGLREVVASVQAFRSPAGERLITTAELDGLRITQEVTLWQGEAFVDIATHVDGSIGQDRLLRSRFDFDLPGALPVAEVGYGVVGRSFGFPDADAAQHLWTMDSPAQNWAGLSATARIRSSRRDGSRHEHAIGIAEVVAPGEDAGGSATAVRELLAHLVSLGVTATCTEPDGPRYGCSAVDSNLPDVRIVLGADNPVARDVLASAPPAYADTLKASGRVFVPARAGLAQRWIPGADLRAPRDLPALIVGGSDIKDAIAGLVDDLADAVIDVAQPADPTDGDTVSSPFDGYSAAVVNRGTPGFVVDPDKTLHVSLMRACSGWPSGVWLDGPTRTTPDGASFAWQHWSHSFALRLVGGDGDWRTAGFVRAGQEANHPLLAVPVDSHDGELPSALSLLDVSPADIVVSALKPCGNDAAAGRLGPPDPAAGVSLRLWQSTGRPETARIRMAQGIAELTCRDLLEQPSPGNSTAARVLDGVGEVDLQAAEVVTLRLRTATPRTAADGPKRPGVRRESDRVHSRYWMRNLGPAPKGYLPVSICAEPTQVRLDARAEHPAATIRLTVATSTQPSRGAVRLVLPPGLSTDWTPADGRYELAGDGFAAFTAHLCAVGATPGCYPVVAQIIDPLGLVVEDTVEVHVADGVANDADGDGILQVSLDSREVTVAPGGTAHVVARLVNHAAGQLHGDVLLVSPFGTWGESARDVLIEPATMHFELGPGESSRMRFTVRAPRGARPGVETWALAKVAYLSRASYSESTAIRVAAPRQTG